MQGNAIIYWISCLKIQQLWIGKSDKLALSFAKQHQQSLSDMHNMCIVESLNRCCCCLLTHERTRFLQNYLICQNGIQQFLSYKASIRVIVVSPRLFSDPTPPNSDSYTATRPGIVSEINLRCLVVRTLLLSHITGVGLNEWMNEWQPDWTSLMMWNWVWKHRFPRCPGALSCNQLPFTPLP